MSSHRQERLRLEVSRVAAKLFWEQGVAATSGQQIAEAAGLSTSTLWRHFRTKESCAEPIVAHSWKWSLAVWSRWPGELSLEEHVAAERALRQPDAMEKADDLAAARMIRLSATEPAIRTAFLMTCDQAERELAPIIAKRLRCPADALDAKTYAAAVVAVVRVISEQDITAVLTGTSSPVDDIYARIARAVREATGGSIGGPVML